VKGDPVFDRSFLPPADLEFVVMTDTHYMLDPGGQRVEFESRRRQSARAAHALGLVGALHAAFVVHLGDLVQEFPESPGFAESLGQALEQFAATGVAPRQVAGNHDVGDKPDPTMPTDWATSETLAAYHARFGPSWYSWDAAGSHFVVINSQILNGPLPEVAEQARWLESDLDASAGRPVYLFMHLSPFLVSEEDAGLGHYDTIDEPARGWLLDLVRRYDVRMLFSGHTHFAFFNRVGQARTYVTPSVAFTRPGFCEVFSSAPPPERGRDDAGKLGFFLVRIVDGEPRVHLLRTGGAIEPPGIGDGNGIGDRRIVTRTTRDLPQSPLGVTLRHTLAPATEVPIAWQSTVRQPVRNDYPLLACVEAGIRHVRVPAADLANPQQRERLAALRDEGVAITAMWIWSERTPVVAGATAHRDLLDGVEIQLPSALLPDDACADAVRECAALGLPVTLAPLLPREIAPGKQHARTRIGYHLDELADLDRHLGERDLDVARVLARLDATQDPWPTIGATHQQPGLARIGAIDWAVEFIDGDDALQTPRATAALAAVATLPGSRLFLEPLVSFDRTMDTPPGLLDRLCNPRPVFHALRVLNTVLFADPAPWAVAGDGSPALERGGERLSLLLAGDEGAKGDGATRRIDLEAGTIHDGDDATAGSGATLVLARTPLLAEARDRTGT
jgi:hypothetical protein